MRTFVKSVVESADSGIESADSTADSAANPLKIGLWVRAFTEVKALISLGTSDAAHFSFSHTESGRKRFPPV